MSNARRFVPGLVASGLAGGLIGAAGHAALSVPGEAATGTAGAVAIGLAAGMAGFTISWLMLRRPSGATERRPASTGSAEPEPNGRSAARPARAGPEQSARAAGNGPAAAVPKCADAGPGRGRAGVETLPETSRGPILSAAAIKLAGTATDRAAAIDEAGALLVATGAVEAGYIASMQVRERSVSTYLGNELAIPHGTADAARLVRRSAIAIVRYPAPVPWHGDQARFVIAIAGLGDDHLKLVSAIAEVFLDESAVARLHQATDAAAVTQVFAAVDWGLR